MACWGGPVLPCGFAGFSGRVDFMRVSWENLRDADLHMP